jgi:hypothetical protein
MFKTTFPSGKKQLSANSKVQGDSFFQPKLTINPPNDIFEQEADAMAEKVMKTPQSSADSDSFFKPAANVTQRKCAKCEDEEKLQRKESDSAGVSGTSLVEQTLQSTGAQMDFGTRSFMEDRFGYDFSEVKIHTGSVAEKSAGSINALAYTHKNHIAFKSGQYNPQEESGKRLLAHELTHVLQQNTAPQYIQRERELDTDESKECLQKVDETIKALETSAADENKKLPDNLKEAIKVLKEKRAQGKIKCYAFEGIKHGRVDYTKDEIHFDGMNKDQINESTVLHEAVHALHGKQYSASAKKYGKAVDEEKKIDGTKGGDLDLLKWKAWTEYWAYRSTHEYYNDKQQKTVEEIHNTVMKNQDVRFAVNTVRNFDPSFDPQKWKPK